MPSKFGLPILLCCTVDGERVRQKPSLPPKPSIPKKPTTGPGVPVGPPQRVQATMKTLPSRGNPAGYVQGACVPPCLTLTAFYAACLLILENVYPLYIYNYFYPHLHMHVCVSVY